MPGSPRTSPPNLVFILADDLGYGDLACQNPDSKIATPNLDRLAAGGMRFTDAHAPSSVCTPSRYSILTGRYCWRSPLKCGVLWGFDPALIEPDRPTVASFLRGHGYRTACVGKWHLGWDWETRDGQPANGHVPMGVNDPSERAKLAPNIRFDRPARGGPIDCGFDSYFGDDIPNMPPYGWMENDRLVELPTAGKPSSMYGQPGPMVPGWSLEPILPTLTKRAVSFIEAQTADQPFFLHFTLTSPHTPVVPTAEFKGTSAAGIYGDFVQQTDHHIGEILDALERKGLAENSLVIFTSDNGPEGLPLGYDGAYNRAEQFRHFSMGELRGAKRDTWEGGHRVPLLARWPERITAGSVCPSLVSLLDLFPTCAEILGEPLPEGAAEDAVGMLELLEGAKEGHRREAVHHSERGHFALRRGDWVFIDHPSGKDAINPEPDWFRAERGYADDASEPGQLFNLADDLPERVNRFREFPDRVAAMKARLREIQGDDAPLDGPVEGNGFSE